MPATTANQLHSMLRSYVEPSGDFKDSLNQVLARMYNMGTYRDLTVQYSLPIHNDCITLPDEADSILHVMIDGSPAPVRALWHDYKAVGMNYNGGDMSWGLIDAGYWPTTQSITGDLTRLYIKTAANSALPHSYSPDDGSQITVVGDDGDQTYTGEVIADTLSGGYAISFFSPIKNISSIRYDGLPAAFDIRLDPYERSTTIATVGPDSGVTRYRRFRISRPAQDQTTVHVLCKRAFQPIRNDDDIVYTSNVGAIKHGMLGRIAEDNADVERAEYHWSKCMLLIEEEMASSRGAAQPRLNVDPFGTNGLNKLRNLY